MEITIPSGHNTKPRFMVEFRQTEHSCVISPLFTQFTVKKVMFSKDLAENIEPRPAPAQDTPKNPAVSSEVLFIDNRFSTSVKRSAKAD